MKEEKIAYPICPISLYFEGDEDTCNKEICDWESDFRSCSESCKKDKIGGSK